MSENEDVETVPPAPVETGLATVAPAQTGVLFSVTEEILARLESYRAFRVTDIHDKEQLKTLQSRKMEVVKARTSVDKTRKTMNEQWYDIIKENNAKGEAIVSRLDPIEADLKKEQKRVEDAIEAERVAKANELFKKRSESLEAIGMTMPEGLIRSSSDEVFEEHMMLLRAQAAERDRLEQQRKDQEEAAAELKRQQEAEAARLQAEQEERDRLERERQEAAQKEADRLRQEEAEKLRLEREDLDRQKEELRKQQEADAEELRLAREELDRLREDARKEKEDRDRQQREAEEAAAKAAEPVPAEPVLIHEQRVEVSVEFLNDGPAVVEAFDAIGIEADGSVKPVAELSFAPDNWGGNCSPEPDLNQSVDAAFGYDTESPRLYYGGSDFNVASPELPEPQAYRAPASPKPDVNDTPEVYEKLANAVEAWLVANELSMSDVRRIPFPMGMISGMIDTIKSQEDQLVQLRSVLLQVPAKTLAKAKEKAGYGDEVTTSEAG